MPLIKYGHAEKKGDLCPDVFEVLQYRNEEDLTVCPTCGNPVRKMLNIRVASVKSEKDMLSPKNLANHGFTQYKKSGDGFYEKTAGEGPQVISADQARTLQAKGKF
ncbi:MAG: zinc ribbon domain-containing protein [Planctomycetaceae bacterium]|nr:zinc ribbon domain-containing protein [Planctomycetaceae bacterium]MBQ2820615.1 zinc ribbon domain-containing protein [Thermoguttaceae bacterium]